ncbi:MAG: hypothetical protein U1B78_08075, partial [Dehalococcoidia bacterium]|nr:hypothetical protein [Dehalococcoidia bacterium]
MAVEAQAAPRTAPAARPRREREQELLVWPDLVFVEFIAAVVFTVAFVVLATVIDAPPPPLRKAQRQAQEEGRCQAAQVGE